jgi:hypothetical protein
MRIRDNEKRRRNDYKKRTFRYSMPVRLRSHDVTKLLFPLQLGKKLSHEDMGEWRYSSTFLRWSQMEGSAKLYASAAYTRGNNL